MYDELLHAAQEVIAAYDSAGPESDWEDRLEAAVNELRRQMKGLGC